jgi:hypothetical protein
MTDTSINSLKKIEIKQLITIDNFHSILPEYIYDNKIIIGNYNDLCNVVINMMKNKYFFNIEKTQLRDLMDDMVFIYNPSSDENIARVQNLICDSDSDSDSDSDGEDMKITEIID